MNWFLPIKTGHSLFDVWSVVHLCFWVVIGANWQALSYKHKIMTFWWLPLLVALVGSLLWEVAEKYLCEPLGMVRHPEMILNRWFSDPLMGVVGMLIGIWLITRQ